MIVFERIKKGDLDGGSVSLVMSFGVSKAQTSTRVCLFLLPVDPDVEPSATPPESLLPACCHIPCHDYNELRIWNCKPRLNAFLSKSCHARGVSSQDRILTKTMNMLYLVPNICWAIWELLWTMTIIFIYCYFNSMHNNINVQSHWIISQYYIGNLEHR